MNRTSMIGSISLVTHGWFKCGRVMPHSRITRITSLMPDGEDMIISPVPGLEDALIVSGLTEGAAERRARRLAGLVFEHTEKPARALMEALKRREDEGT